MSNFFRDNSIAFKPRANIFSRMRVNDQDEASQSSDLNHEVTEENKKNASVMNAVAKVNNTDNGKDDTTGDIFSSEMLNSDNTSIGDGTLGGINMKMISNPKNNMIGSTPKKIVNNDTIDEDELEITEVRNVTPKDVFHLGNSNTFSNRMDLAEESGDYLGNNPVNDNYKNSNEINTSFEPSSNDVLLEAFNNTQKICSTLKNELQKEKQENNKLNNKIRKMDDETNKIILKVSEYRKNYYDLETKLKWFDEQKNNSDNKLHDLKKNNKFVAEKINNIKQDYDKIGFTLTRLKKAKLETENELNKKNKEIEYLKKELDDCSGQLSEEKIKNNNLLSEFETIKAQNADTNEFMKKNFVELDSIVKEFIANQFITGVQHQADKVKEVIEQNGKEIKITMEEVIRTQLEKKITSMKESTNASCENVINSVQPFISEVLANANSSLQKHVQDSVHGARDFLNENIMSTTANITTLKDNIKGDNDTLLSELQKFTMALSENKEYEKKIESVTQENVELKLQKTHYLTTLGTKEAQYDELVQQYGELKSKTSNLEEQEKQNKEDAEKMKDKIHENEKSIERLKDQELNVTSNYENKLASQVTITNTLTSENEMLKQLVKQLEESKNKFDKEYSKKLDDYQNINEQVNKLNIELVQLKAEELELKDENRTLKKLIEDNKLGYEENTNDIKRSKQKIIELESDKQEYMSEKLELLDKIEEKESLILSLNKEAKDLAKQIETMKTNEKLNTKFEIPSVTSKSKEPRKKVASYSHLTNKSSTLPQQQQQQQQQGTNESVKRKRSIIKRNNNIPENPSTDKNIKSNDSFDLSSSLNDDLEMTFPSQIEIKRCRQTNQRNGSRSLNLLNQNPKKKILLSDDSHLKEIDYIIPDQYRATKKQRVIKKK